MQQNNTTILSTRPIETRLVEKAAQKNIILESSSFITTERVTDEAVACKVREYLHTPINAVFTSMNAADAVTSRFSGPRPPWKIFCIGKATADLIKKDFGEQAIADTAGNALLLAEKMINKNLQKVVFFCGDLRREELPDMLTRHGITVEEIIVYRTILFPHTMNQLYDGVLFFSPSAVESFFAANRVKSSCVLFAIGSTTATSIRKYSGNTIIIADDPGKNSLVEKAIHYFDTTKTNT